MQKSFSVRTAVVAIHCVSYDFQRDFVDFWIIHVLPVATHWSYDLVSRAFLAAGKNLNAGEIY